jgi:hypothetical protein
MESKASAFARGQIFEDLPADSGFIGQESAEIWTVQADLQPILRKFGRLLGRLNHQPVAGYPATGCVLHG